MVEHLLEILNPTFASTFVRTETIATIIYEITAMHDRIQQKPPSASTLFERN